MDREVGRQAFHFLVGLIAFGLLLWIGKGPATAAVFAVIMAGTLLMNLRLLGFRIPLLEWFERNFEREGAPLPGWGSACYAVGALMILTFLTDIPEIAACIFILALGDSVSTLAGRMGRMRLPFNSAKTVEGSLAFFIASLPVYYFIGPAAIPLAFAGAIAESLPGLEDNLAIPAVCVAFLLIF